MGSLQLFECQARTIEEVRQVREARRLHREIALANVLPALRIIATAFLVGGCIMGLSRHFQFCDRVRHRPTVLT